MKKYEILINKKNKFEKEEDFEIIIGRSKYCGDLFVENITYKQFKLLQDYALNNNFIIDIESAYRSFDEQLNLFNEIVDEKGIDHTLKFVAIPGYSEHQSGLAIDICQFKNNTWLLEYKMEDTCIKFIEDNAHLFGFIVRYPKNKVHITKYGYEPWHLRFVGKELASKLYKKNITLEEYFI